MRNSFLLTFLYILNLASCAEKDPPIQDAKPEIQIINPVGVSRQFESDRDIPFEIQFRDDLGLESFSITSSTLGISIDSTLGGITDFSFERSLYIEATTGQHSLMISATDTGGQRVNQNIVLTKVESNVTTVSLNISKTYQTISSFGASDAWSTQFVGKNWPQNKREEFAELLFSTEFDTFGNPTGIGLSGWRFNVGAGSAEQGATSDITDSWRRAECFLNPEGQYDWTKQQGQIWFLKKAAEYGLKDLTAFVNSPPVHFTKNGKAYSENGSGANLKSEYYDDYALFISSIIEYLKSQEGIDIKYMSPINEPQWDWKCCNQEGSPWNNKEIGKIVKTLDSIFQIKNITSEIDITEAATLDFLYQTGVSTSRDNQINYFFNPSSSGYLGNLPSVSQHISGHSYFTTWDISKLKTTRENLRNSIAGAGSNIEFWMTEYTLLEDNEEIRGGGRDLGINPALYMARVIHSDMIFANASAWYWWIAISPYDYKDGLIYIDKNQSDGNYSTSKLLWGLGNYARFIRPGMKRIEAIRSDQISEADDLRGLMQSAYMSENEIVVVFVNTETETKEITFDLVGDYEEVLMYQTSSSKDLSFVRRYNLDETILISGRSIVTCVIK